MTMWLTQHEIKALQGDVKWEDEEEVAEQKYTAARCTKTTGARGSGHHVACHYLSTEVQYAGNAVHHRQICSLWRNFLSLSSF